MLPRSRIASVLILGLGAALIVVGLLMPRLLSDDPKIPLNLPDTTYTLRAEEGVASRLLPDGAREDVTSPLRRQLHGELIEPADADRVSVRLGTSVTRELPPEVMGTDPIYELVDADVWTYTVNRLSGEVLGPAHLTDQMAGLPIDVPIDGYWMKLPASTEQKTYPIFDDFLRRTVPAEFVGTEERGGNEVYRFRQTIEPTNLATLYRSAITQLQVDDKTGFLTYSGTRDWIVEPGSGMVVDIRENIDLGWDSREGERLRTYMRFDGGVDEFHAAGLLQQALRVADTTPLRPWSIALIVIGAIFAFGGVAGSFRPENRGGADAGAKTGGGPGGKPGGKSGGDPHDNSIPGGGPKGTPGVKVGRDPRITPASAAIGRTSGDPRFTLRHDTNGSSAPGPVRRPAAKPGPRPGTPPPRRPDGQPGSGRHNGPGGGGLA